MATSENISTARPVTSWRALLSSQRNFKRAQQVIIFIIMAIGAIAMIAPFEWMLATSFSRSANVAMPRIPRFWPSDPSIFNYKVAITNLPLVRYYVNSLIVTAASTLGYLFFSSITGYAFAKGRFVGKSILFIILLTTLMIPFEIRMIPMYLLMRQLHLSDTYAALILPFISGGFGTFLMRQYISAIPDELIDAARMDGAGEVRIYWQIMLPLVRPALAALAIFRFMWSWNDFLWPVIVINSTDNKTLPIALAFFEEDHRTNYNLLMAAATFIVLPVLIIFFAMQKQFVAGITMTGLKG